MVRRHVRAERYDLPEPPTPARPLTPTRPLRQRRPPLLHLLPGPVPAPAPARDLLDRHLPPASQPPLELQLFRRRPGQRRRQRFDRGASSARRLQSPARVPWLVYPQGERREKPAPDPASGHQQRRLDAPEQAHACGGDAGVYARGGGGREHVRPVGVHPERVRGRGGARCSER